MVWCRTGGMNLQPATHVLEKFWGKLNSIVTMNIFGNTISAHPWIHKSRTYSWSFDIDQGYSLKPTGKVIANHQNIPIHGSFRKALRVQEYQPRRSEKRHWITFLAFVACVFVWDFYVSDRPHNRIPKNQRHYGHPASKNVVGFGLGFCHCQSVLRPGYREPFQVLQVLMIMARSIESGT